MIIPKNRAVRQTWTTQLPFSLVNLLHKLFGQFHRFLISGLGIKQLLVCFQLFLATGYLRFFVNALDRIFAHFFPCGCLDRYLFECLSLGKCLLSDGNNILANDYPGRVHGGISAAILDETIGRAISVSDETVWGVTGSLELRYKKPVPIDCDLITVARVTRDTRKLFEGEGEIILPNGEIAVTAKAKYVKMPIDQIADECDMAEEWLPIPDDEPVEYIEIPGR